MRGKSKLNQMIAEKRVSWKFSFSFVFEFFFDFEGILKGKLEPNASGDAVSSAFSAHRAKSHVNNDERETGV